MKKLFAILFSVVMILSITSCAAGDTTSTAPPASTADTTPSEEAPAAPSEETPAPAEPTSFVQGITDTEVLIGNSACTSGAYAAVGTPFLAGLEAYVAMVNDAGGIDGRTINFNHITDDEFDPAKGKAALANLVEDEEAFAIVGHFGTPVVGATIEDLKEYGIPAVYFATGIGQLYAEQATTNEEGYNIFPVQPIYVTEGRIMVAYAVGKFDAAKVGIIYTNDDAGTDIRRGAVAQLDELGIEYVEQEVTAGAADVSAAVTSIKNAGVDFIVVASIQGTMPTIVKELAAQSVNKDCITTYVNVSSAMSEAVVADIQGKFEVYGLGWVAYDDADGLALYQQWAPEEYAMNAYAQTGWIAAHFFCEGLRRLEGKEVTWESYMKALEEAPIKNPFGGVIDYAGGKRLGTQEMLLSRVVPTDETFVTGWEALTELASIDDLLKQ
ncbi:MAG: ABC transporter substrate-binding protein [Oscillospiraceae bacterium]|jgi:ABC-type branched-subunit amino acid transport system substrate-binding protein|nr:ABC transporter substrate-binding protein [Oscillospiraceae bacterium]